MSGGQFIVNITAELHLPLAFVGPAEKAIHLFGLIGNGMGIQAYNSGDWGYRPTAVETGDTGLQQWRRNEAERPPWRHDEADILLCRHNEANHIMRVE